MKDLEALAAFSSELQDTNEKLKSEMNLMKRESKLSRKADKTGQDSLVMLNRELQQVKATSKCLLSTKQRFLRMISLSC